MDYTELVKSLRFVADNKPVTSPELLKDAADAIEELSREYESLAKTVNETAEWLHNRNTARWIPVTERLPGKRTWVLCWCVSNSQEVLRWENNEWYHDPMHVYFSDFVTHWMPLPTPPGGGTE